MPSKKVRESIFQTEFLDHWAKQPDKKQEWGVTYFNPKNNGDTIEKLLFSNKQGAHLVNALPDIWMLVKEGTRENPGILDQYRSQDSRFERFLLACKTITEYSLFWREVKQTLKSEQSTDPTSQQEMSEDRATNLKDADSNCSHAINSGNLKIINISRAKFNPRFQGTRVKGSKSVRRNLTHAGLVYEKSRGTP